MKPGAQNFCRVLVAMILPLAGRDGPAQPLPLGHGKNFTTESYFEPPHERQVQTRLTGAEVTSLPGGLQDVKQVQIESFNVDGRLAMRVRAPQCTYAPFDGVASSAGKLELLSGDGKVRVEGEGFEWRQADSMLMMSNRVHTVITGGNLKLSVP